MALKELSRSQEHLIRGFAPASTASHAIGTDAKDAALRSRMSEQRGLILLVVAISFVQSGGCTESVAVFHAPQLSVKLARTYY